MVIRLASRKSDLARIQAYTVGKEIETVVPGVQVQFHFRESLGDKNLDDPLWKMPEKGVFTEDFVQDLLEDRQDIVVHSWKDLPTDPRPGLEIAATLPREDVRDVLLFKKTSVTKKSNLKVLTSSPRRIFNLSSFLQKTLPGQPSDIEFESVRGNVPTRIQKLIDGDADGLVLAKAALDRMFSIDMDEFSAVQKQMRQNLQSLLWMVLPISANPTAPAQGALAIEIKSGREDLKKVLSKIHCQKTFDAVVEERKEFKKYGGGCHQKIGLNFVPYAFAMVKSLRGQTESGEDLLAWQSHPVVETKKWPDFEPSQLFSPSLCKTTFFDRESIKIKEASEQSLENENLFIARSFALPEKVLPNALVWCSGLSTWEALAQRGIWVNGCSDSLGEFNCQPDVDQIVGEKILWKKLTHEGGYGDNTVATYRLINKSIDPSVFAGKECFYWMSGSQFLRALEVDPTIKNKYHASGPGHTHTVLKEHVDHQKVKVFISQSEWQQEVIHD